MAEINNYSTFDQIMDSLINSGLINAENFDGKALEVFADRQDDFWDGLLNYLQNEKDKLPNGEYGIRDYMFTSGGDKEAEINEQSVVEYISNNADLIDSFLDKCFNGTQPHWNESYQKLIQYFQDMYDADKEVADNIKIGDILSADAGFKFNSTGPWVKPNMNVDSRSYNGVRGDDKIVRILSNKTKMQFTHKLLEKYIRLLMPEYERTVEVEDLNRNFWVIGQVISGICGFLFGENNPFKDLFQGMADEIAQLWENLLYLWVGFVLISQKEVRENPVVLVVPISSHELRRDRYSFDFGQTKFDNFTPYTMREAVSDKLPDTMLAECWNSLQYLKDLYRDSSLIIIPKVKYSNYKENRYAGEIYPGIIFYDRWSHNFSAASDNTFDETFYIRYIPFYFLNNTHFVRFIVTPNDNSSMRIGTKIFANNPWGMREDSTKYYFVKDYKNGENNIPYSAALRTVFTSWSNLTFENGEIKTLDITAEVHDVSKQLGGVTSKVFEGTFSIGSLTRSTIKSLIYTHNENDFNDTSVNVPTSPIEIVQGWYGGEVATWQNIKGVNNR